MTPNTLLPPMAFRAGGHDDMYMRNPFAVGEDSVRENVSPREVQIDLTNQEREEYEEDEKDELGDKNPLLDEEDESLEVRHEEAPAEEAKAFYKIVQHKSKKRDMSHCRRTRKSFPTDEG